MTTKVTPHLINIPERKNLIINGCLRLWQRGTSISPPSSTGGIMADRFGFWHQLTGSSAGATYKQSTDVPPASEVGSSLAYSIELDITSALATPTGSNESGWGYMMEGYDYAQLAGGNATMSFWVKSNVTGIYAFSLRNADVTRSYTVEYTIDQADTWEKKVITIPLTETGGSWSYTEGRGLNIYWTVMSTPGNPSSTSTFNTWQVGNLPFSENQVNLYANANNYFRLTGIQFERGDVSTDLEQRHIQTEVSLCQRYYEWGWVHYIGYNGASGRFGGGFISYCTRKAKTNPSVTLATPTENVNLNGQSITSRQNGFRIWTTSSVAGQYYYTGIYYSESEI